MTKTISKNEGKKKKHTWTQKKTWGSPSAQVWLDDVSKRDLRFNQIQPSQLHFLTALPEAPNHEMAAWKGANELEFSSVIQLTKKNIIIIPKKTKSYMSQGAWPGCIFVQYRCISIFLDIYWAVYISNIYIYVYTYLDSMSPVWMIRVSFWTFAMWKSFGHHISGT